MEANSISPDHVTDIDSGETSLPRDETVAQVLRRCLGGYFVPITTDCQTTIQRRT